MLIAMCTTTASCDPKRPIPTTFSRKLLMPSILQYPFPLREIRRQLFLSPNCQTQSYLALIPLRQN